MNEKKVLLTGGILLVLLIAAGQPFLATFFPAKKEPESLLPPGPTVEQVQSAPPMQQMEAPRSGPGQLTSDQQPPDHPPLDSPESYVELGDLYRQKQNWEAAIQNYRKALEHEPDASVMTSLAICLRETNQIQETLDWLNFALELQPEHRLARLTLGLVQQYDLADYNQAIETFQILIDTGAEQEFPGLGNNLTFLKKVRTNILTAQENRSAQEPAQASPEATADSPAPETMESEPDQAP